MIIKAIKKTKLEVFSITDVIATESYVFFELLIIALILPGLSKAEFLNESIKQILDKFIGGDIFDIEAIKKNLSIPRIVFYAALFLSVISITKLSLAYMLSQTQKEQEGVIQDQIKKIDLVSFENGEEFRKFLFQKSYKTIYSIKEYLFVCFSMVSRLIVYVIFEYYFFKTTYPRSLYFIFPFFIEWIVSYLCLQKQKLVVSNAISEFVADRSLDGLQDYYNSFFDNDIYSGTNNSFKYLDRFKFFKKALSCVYILVLYLISRYQVLSPDTVFLCTIFLVFLLKNLIISSLSSLTLDFGQVESDLRETWRQILGGFFIENVIKSMSSNSDHQINLETIAGLHVKNQVIYGDFEGLRVVLRENINFDMKKGDKIVVFDPNVSVSSLAMKLFSGRIEQENFLTLFDLQKYVDFTHVNINTKNRIIFYGIDIVLPREFEVNIELSALSPDQKQELLSIIPLKSNKKILTIDISDNTRSKLRLLKALKHVYNTKCDFLFVDGSNFPWENSDAAASNINILKWLSKCDKGVVISVNNPHYLNILEQLGFKILNLDSDIQA